MFHDLFESITQTNRKDDREYFSMKQVIRQIDAIDSHLRDQTAFNFEELVMKFESFFKDS